MHTDLLQLHSFSEKTVSGRVCVKDCPTYQYLMRLKG